MNGLPGGHVADGCVNAAESAKGQSPLQVLGPPGKPAPSPSTRRLSCHQQGGGGCSSCARKYQQADPSPARSSPTHWLSLTADLNPLCTLQRAAQKPHFSQSLSGRYFCLPGRCVLGQFPVQGTSLVLAY